MMAFFGANAKKAIKPLSFLGTPSVVPIVCLIYVEAGYVEAGMGRGASGGRVP